MRSPTSLCLLAILAACSDQRPADSAAAEAPVSAAAPLLAPYAGTWNMQTMGATSDSVLLTFTMTATGDTAGWSYTFPSSATPVPGRIVQVAPNAVVTEAGPYASNLNPGMQVTTRATTRLDGDTLRGDVVATYTTAAGDSVVNLRVIGTRAR